MDPYDVAIIGGGPAGSASALYLLRMGFNVCLFEKNKFPRETLCGEFLSNEITESLKELGLFDEFLRLRPNAIDSIQLHTERGQTIDAPLGFTAYGLKRGTFDHFLISQARDAGVRVIQPGEVSEIAGTHGKYLVRYSDASGAGELSVRWIVGAYGKQNILDKRLQRNFTDVRSHLNGVKFHLDGSHCPGIRARAIHLFTGSHLYCGVNVVDDSKVTVCFLEKRAAGDEHPRGRLKRLVSENAAFRNCFTDAFDRHCDEARLYGTGNIYFGRKEAVVNGIFMVGDAAGVIAPLTGDGMGMAFQGARVLAEGFEAMRSHSLDARAAESLYRQRRDELFSRRLRIAGYMQTILLSSPLRMLGLSALNAVPHLLSVFTALTRGSARLQRTSRAV